MAKQKSLKLYFIFDFWLMLYFKNMTYHFKKQILCNFRNESKKWNNGQRIGAQTPVTIEQGSPTDTDWPNASEQNESSRVHTYMAHIYNPATPRGH